MDSYLTILSHVCRSHCVKFKECGNVEYDDSDGLHVIVKNEFVFNSSSYSIYIGFNQKIPGLDYSGGGRVPVRNARKRVNELIYVPYISDSILDFIKKRELSAEDNISNGTLVVAKIKKQIEDKLDEDGTLRQLRKFNIIDEIQQLKKSTLPSKEIIELHQMVKLLQQNHTELYQLVKLLQKDRETDQLEVQKIQKDNAELRQLVKLLQKDKEFEQLPLLKLEEKIRCLEIENTGQSRQLRKTESDIVKLTKHLSDSIKESSGLSFTQANTIGQALMQQDVFNCM